MKDYKEYKSPVITKIELDNTISIVMMTDTPPNPPPRGSANKSNSPFSSPFADKPFN